MPAYAKRMQSGSKAEASVCKAEAKRMQSGSQRMQAYARRLVDVQWLKMDEEGQVGVLTDIERCQARR